MFYFPDWYENDYKSDGDVVSKPVAETQPAKAPIKEETVEELAEEPAENIEDHEEPKGAE